LKKENENLIREKQKLLAENAMLGDVKNENMLLREQLNLIPRGDFNLTAAFVTSQDPNGMGNWLEIDKGSSDGIQMGMPVIVSSGILVGKVQEVSISNAKILLLTNPQSVVNVATLQDGTKGVAKGEYGLGIIFDMILQTDVIHVGSDVVTSGIGGDIPKGLYVGTVQEVHSSDDHLFQQAVISSPIQVSKLQMVFVIKGNK
jgi:rod shape-determining protein MreC